MEHGYALYNHPGKNVTIHAGGTTITQSEYGVTCLYFPGSASPECSKIGNNLYFKTSDTEMTLIPYAAFKDDIPEPKRTDTNQVVFTLYVGSFILKVNGFVIKLKHCSLTEKEIRTTVWEHRSMSSIYYNLLTIEGPKYSNGIFFDERGWYSDTLVIAMPNEDEIKLGNLRKRKVIPFPGAADVKYEVTKVERTEWGGIDVTVQEYNNGSFVGQLTVYGHHGYNKFIPLIPPRVYR